MTENDSHTRKDSELRNKKFLLRATTYLGILATFFFSFWLMFHTFSVDSHSHQLRIGSKLWSDFGAHIPMIRSFSYGPNLSRLIDHRPIESPLFPGEPIRYHFGFYAIAGILEKLGLPLDWAINIPSALGFFLLIVCIYQLSYALFSHKGKAWLAVIFFLFNGSLSFLSFFAAHPLSPHLIQDIVTNSKFPSFGPWDNGMISAFWNLNIYTNQRHLALSYGLALLSILLAKFPSKYMRKHEVVRMVMMVTTLSLLLCINFPVAAIAGIFLGWIFLSDSSTRRTLLGVGLCTLPAFLWLQGLANPSQTIMFQLGYLAKQPLTLSSIVMYWWANLGLHIFLIPIGIFYASRDTRKTLLLPLVAIFLLPNVYRFSPDMINNHKFFNFFIIIGGIFTAHGLYVLTSKAQKIAPLVMFCGVLFLTISGVIDLFPVINDYKGSVKDFATNADADFFVSQTDSTDIIANSTWFYHPASLAGRSLYSGYTYFTWSYGYDQTRREQQLIAIYEAPTIQQACSLLLASHISYIELNVKPEQYIHPNFELWNSIRPMYTNPESGISIYKTTAICP